MAYWKLRNKRKGAKDTEKPRRICPQTLQSDLHLDSHHPFSTCVSPSTNLAETYTGLTAAQSLRIPAGALKSWKICIKEICMFCC